MRLLPIAIAVSVAAFVSGCGPTPKQLQSSGPVPIRFTVDHGYEQVYKNLRDYAVACWAGEGSHLQTDLFASSKTAELSVVVADFGSAMFAIKIASTAPSTTDVRLYPSSWLNSRYPAIMENAARTGDDNCHNII